MVYIETKGRKRKSYTCLTRNIMYCLISLMLILSACTGSIKFHVAGTLSDIVDETEDVSLIVPPPLYTPSSNGPSAPSNYMLEMPKNLTGPMGPT